MLLNFYTHWTFFPQCLSRHDATQWSIEDNERMAWVLIAQFFKIYIIKNLVRHITCWLGTYFRVSLQPLWKKWSRPQDLWVSFADPYRPDGRHHTVPGTRARVGSRAWLRMFCTWLCAATRWRGAGKRSGGRHRIGRRQDEVGARLVTTIRWASRYPPELLINSNHHHASYTRYGKWQTK